MILIFFPIQAAGISRMYAPTIGISVDARRQNLSEEGLTVNVERLKAYMERLIVFPRRSGRVKKTDTPKDQHSAETVLVVNPTIGLPKVVVPAFSEIAKSDMPAEASGGGAYKTLHKARIDKKQHGAREKRARDKVEEEKAKK